MTVRWRLVVLFCQLIAITVPTSAVTGSPFSTDTWYASLIALAVNTQLLEPYFPRIHFVASTSVASFALQFDGHVFLLT
jgi:hypothetical protein